MKKEQKAAVIDRVAEQIQEAEAVFAVDYRGLSVKQAVELRTSLKDAGANFRIVKNTLTERAADKAGAESLKALLEGPTALTFVSGDVALAAKALSQFRRREGILEFKGGQMNGEDLSIDQIEAIARLPAREQLYAQLVGVTASPLTGLVRGLNSLIQGLAVQLGQIAEKGLVGGGEAEAAGAAEVEAAAEASAEPEAAEAEAAAEAPAEPEAESAGEGEPEAAAEEPPAEEAPADEPAAEEPRAEEPPAEAPGDPVAEAEAVEEQPEAATETETESETPSEGAETETEEG
jgi:large subunit ribosomal protein L10